MVICLFKHPSTLHLSNKSEIQRGEINEKNRRKEQHRDHQLYFTCDTLREHFSKSQTGSLSAREEWSESLLFCFFFVCGTSIAESGEESSCEVLCFSNQVKGEGSRFIICRNYSLLSPDLEGLFLDCSYLISVTLER